MRISAVIITLATLTPPPPCAHNLLIIPPPHRVGILDATNSTKSRRLHVANILKLANTGVKVMSIESVCDDAELLAENIRTVKLNTPDYKGTDPVEAVKDFNQRREVRRR